MQAVAAVVLLVARVAVGQQPAVVAQVEIQEQVLLEQQTPVAEVAEVDVVQVNTPAVTVVLVL
jgi:hypothetical protein